MHACIHCMYMCIYAYMYAYMLPDLQIPDTIIIFYTPKIPILNIQDAVAS